MCAVSSLKLPGKMSRDSPLDDQMDLQYRNEGSCKRPRVEDDDQAVDDIGNSRLLHSSRYMQEDKERYPRNSAITDFATQASDSLSSKQQRLVLQWNLDFRDAGEDDVWLDEHMVALATAIKATPQVVLEYIRQQHGNTKDARITQRKAHSGPSSERSSSEPAHEFYNLTGANAHLSSTTLTLVDKYVSACRRRRSQTDGRRSVNTGPYRCTFGCGYRTKRAFDWRRHEETHEPQELWLCELCCQKDTLNPFLVNRRDKFLRHAADKHTGHSAEKVLDMSKVPFVPRAAEGCPFCCVGEAAREWSWDERCKHVLGHFEDEVQRGVRRPVIIHEGKQSGEDGEERSSVDGSVGSAGYSIGADDVGDD